MNTNGRMKKVLAVAAGVVLTTSGIVVAGLAAPTAAMAAAPKVTISPAGPYSKGQLVTVTASGFDAGAPVAIGQCSVGRAVVGPGDCGKSKFKGSKLGQANAQGVAVVELAIVVGPLLNSLPPAEQCGPGFPCYIGGTNISKGTQTVCTVNQCATSKNAIQLTYVGETKTATKTETKTRTFV